MDFDTVLRILMYVNLFIELQFFNSQVIDWKKKFILNETLYQIELQKKKQMIGLKDNRRASQIVDENFTEEAILKQAQQLLQQEEEEQLRIE